MTEYEWDEKKSAGNLEKHQVDFSLMDSFDWKSASIQPDNRRHYDEHRFIALGFIGDRLYICIYTWRHATRRMISLRKANDRERKRYNEKS